MTIGVAAILNDMCVIDFDGMWEVMCVIDFYVGV